MPSASVCAARSLEYVPPLQARAPPTHSRPSRSVPVPCKSRRQPGAVLDKKRRRHTAQARRDFHHWIPLQLKSFRYECDVALEIKVLAVLANIRLDPNCCTEGSERRFGTGQTFQFVDDLGQFRLQLPFGQN